MFGTVQCGKVLHVKIVKVLPQLEVEIYGWQFYPNQGPTDGRKAAVWSRRAAFNGDLSPLYRHLATRIISLNNLKSP